MVYPTVTELAPERRHRQLVRFQAAPLTRPRPAPPAPMTPAEAHDFVDSFLITRYGHTLADAPTGRSRN